jgi:hypothetical protein
MPSSKTNSLLSLSSHAIIWLCCIFLLETSKHWPNKISLLLPQNLTQQERFMLHFNGMVYLFPSQSAYFSSFRVCRLNSFTTLDVFFTEVTSSCINLALCLSFIYGLYFLLVKRLYIPGTLAYIWI